MQDLLPFAVWLLEASWLLVFVAGVWRTLGKLGAPGWAVLVPVYNLVVLARAGGKRGVIAFLFLVPLVNVILLGYLSVQVARRFGRGVPFGMGLLFLPLVFYPVLGFGPFVAKEAR